MNLDSITFILLQYIKVKGSIFEHLFSALFFKFLFPSGFSCGTSDAGELMEQKNITLNFFKYFIICVKYSTWERTALSCWELLKVFVAVPFHPSLFPYDLHLVYNYWNIEIGGGTKGKRLSAVNSRRRRIKMLNHWCILLSSTLHRDVIMILMIAFVIP